MSDRWDALARYNAERARGIAHTPEYAERMAREQALFDAEPPPTVRVSRLRRLSSRDRNQEEYDRG